MYELLQGSSGMAGHLLGIQLVVYSLVIIACIIVVRIRNSAVPPSVPPQWKSPSNRRTPGIPNLLLEASAPEQVIVLLYQLPSGRFQVCVGTPAGFGSTFVAEAAVRMTADFASITLAPTPVAIEVCDGLSYTVVDEVIVALTFERPGKQTWFSGCVDWLNTITGLSKDVEAPGSVIITLNGQAYRADAFLSTA